MLWSSQICIVDRLEIICRNLWTFNVEMSLRPCPSVFAADKAHNMCVVALVYFSWENVFLSKTTNCRCSGVVIISIWATSSIIMLYARFPFTWCVRPPHTAAYNDDASAPEQRWKSAQQILCNSLSRHQRLCDALLSSPQLFFTKTLSIWGI